jgi:putative membrane protein
MKMEPMWITTLMSALIVFLTLAIPVVLIAYGVSLGLSWVRGGTRVIPRQPYDQSKRLLLAVVAIVVGLLWLFLSFNLAVMPAQSPFLVILPVLFFILAQLSIWVLIIAGAVWLVLWLARRMGVVGPARETPLDTLKARYARGEISAEQFEEMKRRLDNS